MIEDGSTTGLSELNHLHSEPTLGDLPEHSAAPHACSSQVLHHVLHTLPLLQKLPSSAVAELQARTQAPGYHTEEQIYQAGQSAEHLFIVATGTVKLVRTTAAGQNVVTEVLGPGEVFGAMAEDMQTYPDNAVAMRPTCAVRIPVSVIRGLMERYPQLSMTTLDQLFHRYEQSRQLISRLSADSVEVRTAAALVALMDKLGQPRGPAVTVPVSQTDLASMVGATPESISRTLGRMRSQGIVATGRGHTEVLDVQRLELLAAS